MKIKEKLLALSIKKRVMLISVILIIVVILAGITVVAFNNSTKSTSSELPEEKIPDVNKENTTFTIVQSESASNNVVITVDSRLENYNLYYVIKATEEIELETENYTLYQDKLEVDKNAKVYFKYELDGKYSENPYELNINESNVLMVALENEEATEEELENEKVKEINNEAKYYITVNYSSNVVTVYEKDANNKYTVPVKAMVCSTGVATPRSGVYKLTTTRYRWGALFGGVYGQYAVKIVGNILFHSVPYLSTNNGALEYWEYDKLGTAASAGCIRLTVADALWIYNNCGSGTQVEFSSSAPSPLGKPKARKISGYENLRGYDPTDPATNNPWRNANIPAETTPATQNNNTNNQPTVSNPQPTTPSGSTPETPSKEETTTNPNKTDTEKDEPDTNKNENNTDNTTKKENNTDL